MGQRHQVFMKSYVSYEDTPEKLSGIHHQWLYGATAIRSLRNLLEYEINADKNYKLSSEKMYLDKTKVEDILNFSYSFNPKHGYVSNTTNLNKLVEENGFEKSMHPAYQDNNDGQTFIDFTSGDKPKYCYTFDRDTTMEDNQENEYEVKMWEPIAAVNYFKFYYDIDSKESGDYVDFIEEVLEDIKWIDENADLMTPDDIKNMFPNLIEEEKKGTSETLC